MKDAQARIEEARSLVGLSPVTFEIADFEVRSAPSGSKSPGGVRFYAAVYGKPSLDLGGFREIIAPGAFDAAIVEDDVRALVNHDANLVLGRSAPEKDVRTAELSSDETGLRVDIPELPDTSYARDLLASLERGDVDQSSFGFRTVRDDWTYDAETDTVIRTLLEARLFDVSIVTFPAYPDTTAEARSIALAFAELRAGKVLSAKSRERVQAALDALTELLAHAGEENSAPEAEEHRHAEGETDEEAGDGIALLRARLQMLELSAPVATHYPERQG